MKDEKKEGKKREMLPLVKIDAREMFRVKSTVNNKVLKGVVIKL